MVSDRQKAQAIERAKETMERFYGREVPEELVETSYDAMSAFIDQLEAAGYSYGPDGPEMTKERANLLEEMFMGTNTYVGGRGLDAILEDLAGRSISSTDVNGILDAWRQRSDKSWSNEAENTQDQQRDRASEAGD